MLFDYTKGDRGSMDEIAWRVGRFQFSNEFVRGSSLIFFVIGISWLLFIYSGSWRTVNSGVFFYYIFSYIMPFLGSIAILYTFWRDNYSKRYRDFVNSKKSPGTEK
jgi:hypothetical protein